MKCFVVLLVAVIGFGSCADTCYDAVVGSCTLQSADDLVACNAKYGAIEAIENDLQKYANTHFAHSFDYLLMSTHFGNYEKSRNGFEKLFRKLSDSTWNDGIELIKYITKRGGVMDFEAFTTKEQGEPKPSEIHELGSLAQALDAQKILANQAHHIHREVTRQRENYHDPEVASYLENHFVHKHADSIRDLSGHGNDLKRLLEGNKQISLAVFLFDEYLQKL